MRIKTQCEFWLAPDGTTDICLKIKGLDGLFRIKEDPTKAAGHGPLYPKLKAALDASS